MSTTNYDWRNLRETKRGWSRKTHSKITICGTRETIKIWIWEKQSMQFTPNVSLSLSLSLSVLHFLLHASTNLQVTSQCLCLVSWSITSDHVCSIFATGLCLDVSLSTSSPSLSIFRIFSVSCCHLESYVPSLSLYLLYIYIWIYLFICISVGVHLPIYQDMSIFIYISPSLPPPLSLYVSRSRSVSVSSLSLFIFISIHLSIYISIYIYTCLSLSFFLSICLERPSHFPTFCLPFCPPRPASIPHTCPASFDLIKSLFKRRARVCVCVCVCVCACTSACTRVFCFVSPNSQLRLGSGGSKGVCGTGCFVFTSSGWPRHSPSLHPDIYRSISWIQNIDICNIQELRSGQRKHAQGVLVTSLRKSNILPNPKANCRLVDVFRLILINMSTCLFLFCLFVSF